MANITPPPPAGSSGHHSEVLLYSKASIYGAIFFVSNLALLSLLLVFNGHAYEVLTKEDSLFEDGTAFLFLVTALLLLAIAARGRGVSEGVAGRWLYIVGALAFVFAAGEEISWGQRMFGFETPDYLRDVNFQNEFNVHNIEWAIAPISQGYRMGIMFLCVATSAAFFSRKSSLFGIPFPSILTMYCFLLMFAYRPHDIVGRFPLSIVTNHNILFLVFAAYALYLQKIRLFTLSVVFISAVLLQQSILHMFTIHMFARTYWEASEYLLSVACAVYAVELFLTLAAHTRSRRFTLSSRLRNALFVLFIGGNLAYVAGFAWYTLGRLDLMPLDDYMARLVGNSPPIIRSDWDVYLMEDSLIYAKDPCGPEDTEPTFFVHLYPVDMDGLPSHRKQDGFDGFNFDFRNHLLDGRVCVARRELPVVDYAVAAIRTGQFTSEGKNIWEGSFDVAEPARDGDTAR